MRFVAALLALLIPLAVDAFSGEHVEFVSEECGISFLHRANSHVTKAETKCAFLVTIEGPEGAKAQISVDLSRDGFAAAAVRAGFEYQYDDWAIRDGTFMWSSAEPVANPLLWGIRATPVQRCYGDDGYEGLCQPHVAVASNFDGRIVTISGEPATGDTFELLVESFRFDLEFTFESDPMVFKEAAMILGASRMIRGLKAPREELWDRFIREVRHGAYAVVVAATLVEGADDESRGELARAVQEAFVSGSSWVLPHVGKKFTFAEICRPPTALQGAERDGWIAKAEKNLARYASDLPPGGIEKCRAEMKSP